MRYDSFETVHQLSSEQLQTLAKTGDAAERVWAAWSQGLRIGARFSPSALATLDSEPNAGIRRHLIIMLAGFWAETNCEQSIETVDRAAVRSILEAMAEFDPDDRVRATAWMNLIQVRELSVTQVQKALDDDSVAVRLVVLNSYKDRWPHLQTSRLAPFFSDSDSRIRRAAIERWIEARPKEDWFTPEFTRLLVQEKSKSIRNRLHVLCRIALREDLIPPEQLEASFPLPRSIYLPALTD